MISKPTLDTAMWFCLLLINLYQLLSSSFCTICFCAPSSYTNSTHIYLHRFVFCPQNNVLFLLFAQNLCIRCLSIKVTFLYPILGDYTKPGWRCLFKKEEEDMFTALLWWPVSPFVAFCLCNRRVIQFSFTIFLSPFFKS